MRTFIYFGALYIQLNASSRGLRPHRVTSCDAIRLKANERDAADPGTLHKRGNPYYYLSYFGRVSREQTGRAGTMSGLFHAARTYAARERERERDEGPHLKGLRSTSQSSNLNAASVGKSAFSASDCKGAGQILC